MMNKIIRQLMLFFTHKVCYTFGLAALSVMGGLFAVLGLVFMGLNVDYHTAAAQQQDVRLCLSLVCLAALLHCVLFGLPRLWGRRWEIKPLRVLNDHLQDLSIPPDIDTETLQVMTHRLEEIHVVNTRTAGILCGLVVLIGVLQEVVVSGNWSNGLLILAGGLISGLIYLMYTYLITEVLTYGLRRDARRLLAERGRWHDSRYLSGLSLKVVFMVAVLFISIVLAYGVSTSRVVLTPAVFVGLSLVLPMMNGIAFFALIYVSIKRPLHEVQQAGQRIGLADPFDLCTGSPEREFGNIAQAHIEASREIHAYRERLDRLNVGLEKMVDDRTAELKALNQDLQQEIMGREQIEDALRESQSQYCALVEYANDGVIIYRDDSLQFANKAMAGITGYDTRELQGLTLGKVLTPESRAYFKERIAAEATRDNGAGVFEVQIVCRDGAHKDVEVSSAGIRYRGDKAFMAILRDITGRKQAEEALRQSEQSYRALSITDDLTKLNNVRYFYSQLKKEAARADRYRSSLALIMLDLDNFKLFNDTWGHLEGDKVLVQLGRTIRSCLREMDSAYRYGGEEFTVILPATTGQAAIAVADRIRAEFHACAFNPGRDATVHMSVSLGISQYREGENLSLLLERADRNMYIAKEQGKNRIYYCSVTEY